MSQVATRQEALANVQEAIVAYSEGVNQRGEPISPEQLVDVSV